ncbi:hypothetical protein Y695_02770 [Hydrogenophaga sp. T4]|nr:hypothetical protein Y695_02770 [Hydrogenophaga sp. T4]
MRAKPVCTSSAISKMPCWSHSARSHFTAAGWMGLKPPSPCTGSNTMAATRLGSMSHLNTCSIAFCVSASELQ